MKKILLINVVLLLSLNVNAQSKSTTLRAGDGPSNYSNEAERLRNERNQREEAQRQAQDEADARSAVIAQNRQAAETKRQNDEFNALQRRENEKAAAQIKQDAINAQKQKLAMEAQALKDRENQNMLNNSIQLNNTISESMNNLQSRMMGNAMPSGDIKFAPDKDEKGIKIGYINKMEINNKALNPDDVDISSLQMGIAGDSDLATWHQNTVAYLEGKNAAYSKSERDAFVAMDANLHDPSVTGHLVEYLANTEEAFSNAKNNLQAWAGNVHENIEENYSSDRNSLSGNNKITAATNIESKDNSTKVIQREWTENTVLDVASFVTGSDGVAKSVGILDPTSNIITHYENFSDKFYKNEEISDISPLQMAGAPNSKQMYNQIKEVAQKSFDNMKSKFPFIERNKTRAKLGTFDSNGNWQELK